eukprot:2465469-Pyramimonas_sp.AAC.1
MLCGDCSNLARRGLRVPERSTTEPVCRPLRKKAVVPPGVDVISIQSDDIVDDFDSDVVVDKNKEEEDYNN